MGDVMDRIKPTFDQHHWQVRLFLTASCGPDVRIQAIF